MRGRKELPDKELRRVNKGRGLPHCELLGGIMRVGGGCQIGIYGDTMRGVGVCQMGRHEEKEGLGGKGEGPAR